MHNFKKLVTLGLVLTAPALAFGEILFSDTFDEKLDWSVPYATTSQACNMETGCTNKPPGYYGFYISPSVIPPNGHGLHLNATNHRGATGKGLTFWDQTDGTVNWTSGMQIGVDFPARKEVYVRYWIKMQPGYKYIKASTASMMRKLNHISHYVYNGKPFTFFNEGGHHPTTVNQIAFANNNIANLRLGLTIRPDSNYNGTQSVTQPSLGVASSTGPYNYFDLPDDALPRGNYSGTGTEYNSPGMMADGKWHSLEFYLKTNTAPGAADGLYKFWLDGVLQIDAGGLIYRDATSTLPENIWNFVHIGGNAYNPFLGLGVSGEQWYAVDDLVIATTYSGPPAKPVNLKASALSSSAIRLSWAAGSNGAAYPVDGYRIYYGTDAANLNQTMTVANVAQADVTNLLAGKTYYFSVAAFHKGAVDANENESLRSVRASAATGAGTITPTPTPSPTPTATSTPTPTPTPTPTSTPVPGDTTAPSVAITSPVYGAKLGGVVTVSASASDNVGVSKVEFYVSGVLKATDTAAPYAFSWDTRPSANATYTLSARAYDAAGNVKASSGVAVTVFNDKTLPTLTLSSPTSSYLYSSTLTIKGSATDNVGVTKIQVFVDGTNILNNTTSSSFSVVRTVAKGKHTIIVRAYDAANNIRSVTKAVERLR